MILRGWTVWKPGSRFVNLVLCVALMLAVAAGGVFAETQPERIVAVGDVHGSFDGLTTILQATNLIDRQLAWSGGTTTLVQIGDLLDRGVELRGVLDLMMRLQLEAAAAGGEVICLLGNHEAMNLLGLVRDVNPEAFARFADDDSIALRQKTSRRYAQVLERRADLFKLPAPHISWTERSRLLDGLPLGQLEYSVALGPGGRYGGWLRTLPVAVRRGKTMFVHAGIGPALGGLDLTAVNAMVAEEIRIFDDARTVLSEEDLLLATAAVPEVREVADLVIRAAEQARGRQALTMRRLAHEVRMLSDVDSWGLVNADGPLWFRGATEWDEEDFTNRIAPVLDDLGVDRIVVGHSPMKSGRIESRFDGTVFAIDTGMLSEYYEGGRASALEIKGDTVTAIYTDEPEVLSGGSSSPGDPVPGPSSAGDSAPRIEQWRVWRDPDGQQLPFRTDAELEDFLLNAEVLEDVVINRGVTKPHKLLLERDGVRAHAVFKDVDILEPGATKSFRKAYMNFRDYHLYEVAAYRMDRLLGINRVPPAVPRTVNNSKGTVQMWIEDTIMDVDRRDLGLSPPNPLRWRHQRQVMEVFDNLIGNADSNLGNLLIDATWTLWFIDHTRSFVTSPVPLYPQKIIFCERTLWQALQTLDLETVSEVLSPYLSKYEIGAMMSRRDRIVEHIQGLIDARGEVNILYDLLPPEAAIEDWPPAED